MVHTRYGLTKLRTAEVRRGCIFNEPLNDPADVLKNGGVIGSGAKFVSPQEGFKFSGAAGGQIGYGEILRFCKTAITLSLWVKYSTAGDVGSYAYVGQSSAATNRNEFYTNGINIILRLYLAGGDRSLTTPLIINDGKWHHIVGTWSSGVPAKIYIDGILKATSGGTYTGELTVEPTIKNFTIGSLNASLYFAGSIRNCMVFNTALDADEISAYYTGTMFRYDDYCVCDLPFDIAHHDTVNKRSLDVSGYNNHATWGDGSTSTTFPTKLANSRGYSFDGGDYMRTPILPTAVMSSYIMFGNRTPNTKTIFGSAAGGFTLYWVIRDTVTSGNLLFYIGSGSEAYSKAFPNPAILSFCMRTDSAANKHRILENGVIENSNSAVRNPVNGFEIALGGLNVAGAYTAGPVQNIYTFKHYSKYLNQLQAMDIDIRAKECLSKC